MVTFQFFQPFFPSNIRLSASFHLQGTTPSRAFVHCSSSNQPIKLSNLSRRCWPVCPVNYISEWINLANLTLFYIIHDTPCMIHAWYIHDSCMIHHAIYPIHRTWYVNHWKLFIIPYVLKAKKWDEYIISVSQQRKCKLLVYRCHSWENNLKKKIHFFSVYSPLWRIFYNSQTPSPFPRKSEADGEKKVNICANKQ